MDVNNIRMVNTSASKEINEVKEQKSDYEESIFDFQNQDTSDMSSSNKMDIGSLLNTLQTLVQSLTQILKALAGGSVEATDEVKGVISPGKADKSGAKKDAQGLTYDNFENILSPKQRYSLSNDDINAICDSYDSEYKNGWIICRDKNTGKIARMYQSKDGEDSKLSLWVKGTNEMFQQDMWVNPGRETYQFSDKYFETILQKEGFSKDELKF